MKTPLHRIRTRAVVLCAVVVCAVLGYRLTGRDWLDALYVVVITVSTGAHCMASIITRPSTIELLELVSGQSTLDVELDEIALPPTSALAGKTIVDAETRRLHGLLVVAVKQGKGAMVFNPGTEVVFQAGDTLIVMGHVEDIDRFRRDYSA